MKILFLEIRRSVEVNVYVGQLIDIYMTIRCSSQDQNGSHEGLNGVPQKSIIRSVKFRPKSHTGKCICRFGGIYA